MVHRPQSPAGPVLERLMVAIHTKERHSMSDKGEVCVIGTGHIGLPLAAVGFGVTGYDTNDDFVTRVNTIGTAG